MKPLVSASYAQFGVDAEDERYRALVMAYDPRPSICGDLLLLQTYTYLTDGFATELDRTCIVAKAMCSVACLEWDSWDR